MITIVNEDEHNWVVVAAYYDSSSNFNEVIIKLEQFDNSSMSDCCYFGPKHPKEWYVLSNIIASLN